MAAAKVQRVQKVYSFVDPKPPSIHEIFKTSEYEDPTASADQEDGEQIVEEKKPKWLVRGDLSDSTAVPDMLNLRYLSVSGVVELKHCVLYLFWERIRK